MTFAMCERTIIKYSKLSTLNIFKSNIWHKLIKGCYCVLNENVN